MAFNFKDVLIMAFDIHPTVQPFLSSSPGSFFQKKFEFLANKKKYNQQYNSGTEVKTKSFIIGSLSNRRKKTKLWNPYISGEAQNAWKIQLPLKCFPQTNFLVLKNQQKDFTAEVSSHIYLSPVGWSTNLMIRLRGNILNQNLINFVSEITDKAKQPFLIENNPSSLVDFYKHIHNLLLNEVYQRNNPPHLGMGIPNRLVVSLNKYDDQLRSFDSFQADDWGLMRGILFGKEFNAIDEIIKNNKDPLLRTTVSQPYNFALTNFDKGSLVFLQEDALDPKKKEAVICHAHNIRDCLVMIFALLNFEEEANKASSNKSLDTMHEQVKSNLVRMYKNYKNQICQEIFSKHSRLKELIPKKN